MGVPYQAIVEATKAKSWQDAVRDLCGPEAAYLWTVDDHRAAAPVFSLAGADFRVLDVDCGRGTHAFALSRACRVVYATDPDPDAVRFVATRARQSAIRNVCPFLGPPEDVIRPESLDLVIVQGSGGAERAASLAGLLKPGGTMCLGISNPRSPLCKTGRDDDGGYAEWRSTLADSGLEIGHTYAALPNHQDVRVLIDTEDPRGLKAFLRHRYPGTPSPGWLVGPLLRRFHGSIAPGYWAIAQRGPGPRSLAVRAIRDALGDAESPAVPLIYANRGTYTLPVFGAEGRRPLAILRVDAARSLVAHEAKALKLIANRGDPDLTRTVPEVLWEGTIADRHASLQTAIAGRPIRIPRTPRALRHQLSRLQPWLSALHRVPVGDEDLAHPLLDETRALYWSENGLRSCVRDPGLADRIWKALARLRQAGLRPTLIQGDFHAGNVLVHSRKVAVLDWEYASVSWAPFDWLHYICSAILDQRKRAPSPGKAQVDLGEAFDERDPRFPIIRETTCHLMASLHLDPRLWHEFCALGIFDFIRRRFGVGSLQEFLPLFDRLPSSDGV